MFDGFSFEIRWPSLWLCHSEGGAITLMFEQPPLPKVWRESLSGKLSKESLWLCPAFPIVFLCYWRDARQSLDPGPEQSRCSCRMILPR